MDKVIKNLKPDLYQSLLSEVLTSNVENHKKIIEKFLRTRLNLTARSEKRTKAYWLARGWTADESYVKSKENKQKNCKSVYSREFWLEKISPNTGTNYTEEEADFERNSRRPIRKEYWIKKGYSENDAVKLAQEAKEKNNKKGAKNAASSTVRKVSSKRCVEYYTAKGHSLEQAKELVSASQRFFSKDICIQKYGEEEGLRIWKVRQDAWQEKLNSKSDEEKARINKLKLCKNGTISKGERLLLNELMSNNIKCTHQYAMQYSRTNYFVYDIVYNNKIIEYHGDFWHANPKRYKETDILNWPGGKQISVQELWKKDQLKLQFAKDQGYEVLVVWESDFNQDKQKVINQCIQFLTQ